MFTIKSFSITQSNPRTDGFSSLGNLTLSNSAIPSLAVLKQEAAGELGCSRAHISLGQL